jgi:hypothetical protein
MKTESSRYQQYASTSIRCGEAATHMTRVGADDVTPLGPKFGKLRFHQMSAGIQAGEELPSR